MKRLGCLFLVMILALISASALAEQFTLRDGIQFGMSIDEIKKIEQEAGYEVEESTGFCKKEKAGDGIYLTFLVDNLAGIGGRVNFIFSDTDNKLNECGYEFRKFDDNDVERLIDAYCNKYGDAIAIGDDFVDIQGDATDALDIYAYVETLADEMQLKKYYQWVYSLDDGGAVDIMLVEWNEVYIQKSLNIAMDSPEVWVTYSYRSPSEMQAVYDMVQEKQAAVDSDV